MHTVECIFFITQREIITLFQVYFDFWNDSDVFYLHTRHKKFIPQNQPQEHNLFDKVMDIKLYYDINLPCTRQEVVNESVFICCIDIH